MKNEDMVNTKVGTEMQTTELKGSWWRELEGLEVDTCA
jgi:hypothetical protein